MPLALITGASGSLGPSIATHLAQAGYDLLLHTHQSSPALKNLLEFPSLSLQNVQADFSTPTGQRAFIAQVSKMTPCLDLLVHNAGLYESGPFQELSYERYTHIMAVNTQAPLFITQGLLPLFMKSHNPQVIFMADAMMHRGAKNTLAYRMSKSAICALTQGLAIELAPRIRVNAIAPGIISLPKRVDEDTQKKLLHRIPLHRWGTPEDIAKTIVFLAQDAPYMTGQILTVDGGLCRG